MSKGLHCTVENRGLLRRKAPRNDKRRIFFFGLVVLIGCVSPPAKLPPQAPIRTLAEGEILAALDTYGQDLERLSASGTVRLRLPFEEAERSLDASLAASKPGRLRFSARDVFEKRMDLLSAGGEFFLLVNAPGEKKIFRGKAEEVSRRADFPLGPELIIESLGMGPIHRPDEARAIFEKYPETYVVTFVLPSESGVRLFKKVWMDRRTLRIVRMQTFLATGDIFADVFLDDFQSAGNIELARRIRIEWPFEGSFLDLKLRSLKANPALPEKLWEFQIPKGYEIVPVEGPTGSTGKVLPSREGNTSGDAATPPN